MTRDEFDKLAALLNHLHVLTGLKLSLMDGQAREVFSSSDQADFCRRVKAAPGGTERCVACDRLALKEMDETRQLKEYRCHCGLTEVALPVLENGEIIASILFGQFLDERPKREQWAEARRALAWRPDADELEESFMALRQVSAEQLFSLTEILRACVSEARLQGLLSATRMTDAARLTSYIQRHYARPIPIDALCRELHMGRSRLFELCRREFHQSPGQLILKARMDAAKELLARSSYDLSEIARMVGVPDVRYFSKRYQAAWGETPRAYRQRLIGSSRR